MPKRKSILCPSEDMISELIVAPRKEAVFLEARNSADDNDPGYATKTTRNKSPLLELREAA